MDLHDVWRMGHPGEHEYFYCAPGHQQDQFTIKSSEDLGDILLICLHKEPRPPFPESSWYCSRVIVQCPVGKLYYFPCYQWIEGYQTMELREGTARTAADETYPLLLQHRELELKSRRESYRWRDFFPGTPRCINISSPKELNSNNTFSLIKLSSQPPYRSTHMSSKLKIFSGCCDSWKTLDDLQRVFWFNRTPVSEYVCQHWKEDVFFGYQFLNGTNPVLIRRCSEIPANFPLAEEMVAPILGDSTCLQNELQKGNIFIVDYKILEGIPANVINGRQQFIAAPLCLLYRTPKDEIVPMAIQISQIPGPDSPIFLPTDSEWDWILAKIWVRNADFHVHQIVSHLLRTHLCSEVFWIATIRHLPMCHPVYKLLIPHLNNTVQVNILARTGLLGTGMAFDRAVATGQGGVPVLLQRGLENMTYSDLCLPDDLRSRNVLSLPQYYYRDDGLEVWTAIERFVLGIVECYFKSNTSVQNDHELQAWVNEIYKEGFLERKSSGIPDSLKTRLELVEYLTMVIFTCTAQHAAINSGQLDFCSWMPNAPASMRSPPPRAKGLATVESVLETLPDVNSTCTIISVLWMLNRWSIDITPLGWYSEEYFTEEEPKQCLKDFQLRVAQIALRIEERNRSLALKYNYLNPKEIENSISI
ncbi:hydroperoxide isomerase ALOXE3-like [Pleurodeles waltl]|uniref:hydroperoxide isomerase ALOXE3-like n=1 Tax=Pleurodeles waltl TaxID=8319 RepID=UPI003709ABC3